MRFLPDTGYPRAIVVVAMFINLVLVGCVIAALLTYILGD